MNKKILLLAKDMAIYTTSKGTDPDILLGENINEQRKLHKFVNGWF